MKHAVSLSFAVAALAACATPQEHAASTPVAPPRFLAPPELHRAQTSPAIAVEVENPVTRGELPWWHGLKDGIYRSGDDVVILGVGTSSNHHHVAEGFLASKVNARLAVRRSAERVRFAGSIPEPVMQDLFITRERKFLALYTIRVPKDAGVPPSLQAATPPDLIRMAGRRRVGRHIYEGDRHLFLECDVEGPIANPDWGRTRASARN